jgi:O-antigen/teichoic acid export membrane protein
MPHLTIAKNTFYQILARACTSFIGFLITIIIARKFGVLGYGDFVKVTSFIALFYLVLDFGLNAFFLQYEKANFKNLFYLRIFISFIVFASLNLIALVLPYNAVLNSGFSESIRTGIFIFSFSIFSQSIIVSTSAIFQKTNNYFPYMMGIVIGAIANLTLVLIFAFLNYSIFLILFAFVASSFISALLLLKLTRESISPNVFDRQFAKEIFIKSLPIGLMLIFNLIYFRADMFLLSLFSSTKAVGIYGLSYKFFDFLIALPLFLSNAIYPFLIKAKNEKLHFFNLARSYFIIFLLTSVVIIIPFWFASPLFTLIKSDFALSIVPFRILLLSLPFFFTTSFLQWVLITLEKQKYLMYVYLISTIINILLNIIFIPQFSYIACATITLVSEGLVFVFLVWKVASIRALLAEQI